MAWRSLAFSSKSLDAALGVPAPFVSVHRILRQMAEPIGRAPTIGRPWLWRLRDERACERRRRPVPQRTGGARHICHSGNRALRQITAAPDTNIAAIIENLREYRPSKWAESARVCRRRAPAKVRAGATQLIEPVILEVVRTTSCSTGSFAADNRSRSTDYFTFGVASSMRLQKSDARQRYSNAFCCSSCLPCVCARGFLTPFA
jgi:hypothetical protein